jgi:hypothetical protein
MTLSAEHFSSPTALFIPWLAVLLMGRKSPLSADTNSQAKPPASYLCLAAIGEPGSALPGSTGAGIAAAAAAAAAVLLLLLLLCGTHQE